jgi:peptidoglycan hydrolase-like protein with peptidoglycan-binding domain
VNGRGRKLLTGGAFVVFASAGLLVAAGLPRPTGAQSPTPPAATAKVERRTLNATTQVSGTLGFADAYAIANAIATTADPAAALQSYASALVQYDAAVSALDALRNPRPADVAKAQAQLAKVKSTYATARSSYVDLTAAATTDIAAFQDSLATIQSQIDTVILRMRKIVGGGDTGDLRSALNALSSANAPALQNARANSSDLLSPALAAYRAARDAMRSLLEDFENAIAAGSDTTAIARGYHQAQTSYAIATSRLTSALDLTSSVLATIATSVTTAQAALNTQATRDLHEPFDEWRTDLMTLYHTLSAEQERVTTTKLRINQAGSGLTSLGDIIANGYASAAQAALDVLPHPTAAQMRQAEDAVASAGAMLAAAQDRSDQPRGVLTQVADVGSVIKPGDVLYTLDGIRPTVLLMGAVPAWRRLEPGVSDGADVRQLEANLEALGFASSTLEVDDHWDAETTAAVRRWQSALGRAETGAISLGEVVFEPSAIRITAHSATLGATIQAGAAVLQATSTSRVVTIALQPSLQSKVKIGDTVSVTLPDGRTAKGTVSHVSSVATAAGDARSTATPTITVLATLDDPSGTRGLDQAPVTVNITTATARDVLAVPVGALVQLLDRGYAVQVQEGDRLHYVPVQLGLFAGGWVQVSGDGLAAGQTVVVAQ